MLAPRSLRHILPFLIIGVILTIFTIIIDGTELKIILALMALCSFIWGFFLAWFFRDPTRECPMNDDEIYSPADGTILKAEIQDKRLFITIRMSPFDVHLNRAPVEGEVTHLEEIEGRHLPVYFSKGPETNYRKISSFETQWGDLKVVQIAGIFARNIEQWVKIGEKVIAGQKIGMIRFGSQTNLIIEEIDNVKLLVKPGNKVNAGITVIAVKSKAGVEKDE
ncbi:MAG: phosphatidylserine decarboxylase [Candidatus Kariarchaeaceae archaeon]